MVDKFSRVLMALFFGCVAIGILNATVKPDPIIVRVPSDPVVVYKDGPTKTVTKTVTAPLPDSCKTILEAFDQMLESNQSLTDNAERLEDIARNAPLENYLDPTKTAPLQEKINKLSESTQENLMVGIEARQQVDSSYIVCKADVAKAAADD